MDRTRPLRIALAAALALPLIVLFAGGCTNPFKPATPEPPSGEAIVEDFSSIESMLATMAAAIQARSTNGANAYIHAFAESTVTGDRAFRAFHDPTVKAAWLAGSNGQPAPEPWTLDLERRGLYTQLSGIRPNDPYYEFLWLPDPDSPIDGQITPDVTLIHRKYQLSAITANGDRVIIVSGFADMLVQQVGSRFSIFEWRDRVDPKYGVSSVDVKCFTYERLESQ